MGKSKDLATGETRFVNTAGDTMTGTLVAGTRLQVGDSSITQQYPTMGYVADFQASTGSQTFISIAEPSASSLGNNGVIIGEDATDTYITQRGNKNIKLATQDLNRLVIDGSGRVTKPYQPSFLAYGPSSWITVSGGSTNAMTLSSTGYNVGSHYNASNYTFTAPVAGRYLFHLKTYVKLSTTDDDSNHAYTNIQKNGSNYYASYNIFGYFNKGDVDQNADVTTIMSLSANDTVRPVMQAASGDALYYGNACSFYGILLS